MILVGGFIIMLQQELNLIINKAKKIYSNIEYLEKNNQVINKKFVDILDKSKEEIVYEYSKLNDSNDFENLI